MAQTGGVLAFLSMDEKDRGEFMYFMGIDKARFRHPVVPGDQLILELTLTRSRGNVSKMSGKASVGEQLVAEAQILAMTGGNL
jgi:3-hydroxymyristoyl/3-hydroxydecanoyl-(acyl carrier protein) dehydratase